MPKTINVLFTGLGSIGTRHLKNLHFLAEQNDIVLQVDALRHNKSRELPLEIKSLINNEYTRHEIEKMPQYHMAFLTNPTHLHFETMQMLRGKISAWFIEKPIFESVDYNIQSCLQSTQKAYVAAPMRWCGVMLELKKILPQLKVYSARVICSSYLPSWRPNVDYRTVYSAHKSMGGGVTIDLIHEWDYLVHLFGMPLQTFNFKGTYSHLEIDSDDLSIYIAKYKNLLCEVHLDYFGRDYKREIELYCENGTVIADFGKGTLTLEDKSVKSFEEPVNERYLREMNYFINYAINGTGESVNTPQTALEVLKLTLGEQEKSV